MRKYDTVVISDLHLGARNSRTADLLSFLSALETDQLIIAGDLFDCPRLKGLSDGNVAVVNQLRRMSKRCEVIWLRGNHDPSEDWYDGLLGLPLTDEAVFDAGGKSYLVAHGHLWDKAMLLPTPLLFTAEAVYLVSQQVDPSHRLAKLLKRRTKYFCRAVKSIREKAVAAALDRGFDGVVLGHSHVVEDQRIDGIHYLNCGCWTERPATFVGAVDGQVRTYEWESFLEPFVLADFSEFEHDGPATTALQPA